MRVRTYGLVLLALVGIAPLIAYGSMAIARAQRTSVQQVREGNRRLARSIAEQIHAYARAERQLVATIGAAVLQARPAHARQLVLDSYALGSHYQHLHDIVVYDHDGAVVAGQVPAEHGARYARMARDALAGRSAQSEVTPARESERFSHALTVGEPVDIAGQRQGAIIARYDLVGVWPAVNSVRVGQTGFVRLLTTSGLLLAHGNPEERRFVFDHRPADGARVLAGALLGQIVENEQGAAVVAACELVPGMPWLVVVEQSVTEAFADVEALERNLVILGLAALVFAVAVGLLFGRGLVRGLEQLRAHTRALAHDLEHEVAIPTRLLELRTLAEALDAMARDLLDEREATRARERLTTFARVAAGLAHDLRLPIEAVRGACEMVTHAPDDEGARDILRSVTRRDLPRLKRFVDDLQRLAQRGNLGLEYESLDPRALLDDVRAELERAPKWRGVSFATRGNAAPATLDRNLVRRAVINLAGNAADACLERGLGHAVTLEVADDDEMLEIRVCDTGVGISAERLDILRQGDFQSTKRANGVGLGLGVVRQVVATHGGRLLMSSQVGAGSNFALRLPRRSPRTSA